MIRTWMVEFAIVSVVLLTVSALTGGGIELIGALAVIASFAHGQVADRLAAAETARRHEAMSRTMRRSAELRHAVDCYRWAARYFTAKETLWFVYFVAHRSWSALAGVGLFLVYPIWRRWWRSRRSIRP